MTDLVGHFLLFAVLGVVFLLFPLVLGLFVRPKNPTSEKQAVYECGEPTIGSSFVQFDVRFYVVALLFIIFDVEIAFFFPWATVFGGANQLIDSRVTDANRVQISERLLNVPPGSFSGVTDPSVITVETAQRLAWTGLADIAVFFGVLLVGFAYVWKRGDLDWVRAMTGQAKSSIPVRTAVPRTDHQPQSVA
ncbi:MAG: NADH-quinone oxidoreductase subunit A [Planctomycetales bacterium]|nr:NADH-quinone oxidoreductase subunit A [Planctomycetales bacterium]